MLTFRSLSLALAFSASLAVPAQALVGPSEDGGAFAAQAVMILARGAGRAGFCSGVVIAPDIVLTAAHCVAAPDATRVHFRGPDGAPVLIGVAHVARHPQYRADAVAARAKSVDLALVQAATPLPAYFSAAAIGVASSEPGAAFIIAGFGMRQENAAASSGVLRSARMKLRAPISNLLLWLDNAEGAGACTGDSGAPVFEAGALVAVVAFAQGAPGHACGKLTQAVRAAPERVWIDRVIAGWR